MKTCKPDSIKQLDTIVGDDGYVDWKCMLSKVELPRGITFVNSSNRFVALKKFDDLFDKIQIKFKTEKFNFKFYKKFIRTFMLG